MLLRWLHFPAFDDAIEVSSSIADSRLSMVVGVGRARVRLREAKSGRRRRSGRILY